MTVPHDRGLDVLGGNGSRGTTNERAVFLAAAASTFVAAQLLWDGQFITYPMFRRIRDLDESVFVQVHQDYVKGLGIPTYLPMSIFLLTTALLLRIRPPEIPLRVPLLMNALNAVGVTSTFRQLVPIHIRIDIERRATAEDVEKLIRYNRVRFGLVAVNAGVMLSLLARALTDAQTVGPNPDRAGQ
jgi:hypothetical protein